jgi:hypothetical protein
MAVRMASTLAASKLSVPERAMPFVMACVTGENLTVALTASAGEVRMPLADELTPSPVRCVTGVGKPNLDSGELLTFMALSAPRVEGTLESFIGGTSPDFTPFLRFCVD